MMKDASNRLTIVFGFAVLILFLGSCSRDPERAKTKYLVSGRDYMKKGQYDDANVEFRNAIRLDPRSVEAYYQLAQADLARNDWGGAYVSLEKAIALDPGRLDARLDLGRLYIASRNFTAAEVEANNILKLEPDNVAAIQIQGASLIGQQNPREAHRDFLKVTELRPLDPTNYVNLALVEISLQDFEEAEQHLKKAVAVDPKSILANTDLANFYRLRNRPSEAEQVFQDAIARNPDGTSLYLDWASMLAIQGRKDDAESVLERLRKQFPNSAEPAQAIGDFYFQRKETDRALVEYRRALSIAPKSKDLEIKKRMQDLYITTGQTQLATGLDQELMKNAPKDTFVRIDHGRLLMAQGNTQNAITYLHKVVADAADSPQAHYYLAMAYLQNGDLEQARGALTDVLKVAPELPIALEALSRLSLSQGNAADAQIYAREVIAKHPADLSTRLLLAEALVRQKQFKSAEEQTLIAKQLAPNDPMVHLKLAQLYSSDKRWPEAQKEFEVALELAPQNTSLLGEYADYLISRSQTGQALDRIREYVTSSPNEPNGHVMLGAVYYDMKNYDAARAEFEHAIQLDPNQALAYIRLGKLSEDQGQIDLAIASYQKALDLQPRSAPLATMLGNFNLNKGDLERARKYYAQALEADPNFAVALANTAWVYAQEGKNLDIALGMAEKAKSLMPDLLSITDTLAWVMYKRGDFPGAMPLFQECVQKDPHSAVFHYHLGMNMVANRQTARGKEELETALHMKLDSANAAEARQRLAQLN
jgi:Tfp pilus assembly protein PilF